MVYSISNKTYSYNDIMTSVSFKELFSAENAGQKIATVTSSADIINANLGIASNYIYALNKDGSLGVFDLDKGTRGGSHASQVPATMCDMKEAVLLTDEGGVDTCSKIVPSSALTSADTNCKNVCGTTVNNDPTSPTYYKKIQIPGNHNDYFYISYSTFSKSDLKPSWHIAHNSSLTVPPSANNNIPAWAIDENGMYNVSYSNGVTVADCTGDNAVNLENKYPVFIDTFSGSNSNTTIAPCNLVTTSIDTCPDYFGNQFNNYYCCSDAITNNNTCSGTQCLLNGAENDGTTTLCIDIVNSGNNSECPENWTQMQDLHCCNTTLGQISNNTCTGKHGNTVAIDKLQCSLDGAVQQSPTLPPCNNITAAPVQCPSGWTASDNDTCTDGSKICGLPEATGTATPCAITTAAASSTDSGSDSDSDSDSSGNGSTSTGGGSTTTPSGKKSGGSNILSLFTNKAGPLPVWGWISIVVVVILLIVFG